MRRPEAGVTLVEMLVALALFALVGLAAVTVLDTVIRTRDRTEGRLEEVAALDRALILVGRDLGQSDPGSHRLQDGALLFSLAGSGGPEEMAYALGDGTLLRRAGAVEQPLVGGVAGVGWRLLDGAGAWHEAWPAEGATPPLRGIELRLTLDVGGTARKLVELAPGVGG